MPEPQVWFRFENWFPNAEMRPTAERLLAEIRSGKPYVVVPNGVTVQVRPNVDHNWRPLNAVAECPKCHRHLSRDGDSEHTVEKVETFDGKVDYVVVACEMNVSLGKKVLQPIRATLAALARCVGGGE